MIFGLGAQGNPLSLTVARVLRDIFARKYFVAVVAVGSPGKLLLKKVISSGVHFDAYYCMFRLFIICLGDFIVYY